MLAVLMNRPVIDMNYVLNWGTVEFVQDVYAYHVHLLHLKNLYD